MKKLTTAKIWQFAAGQFGWALLSGIISNWLVYFYQPDETAISQGQTVFIPQGLVIFGVLPLLEELQLSEEFSMHSLTR